MSRQLLFAVIMGLILCIGVAHATISLDSYTSSTGTSMTISTSVPNELIIISADGYWNYLPSATVDGNSVTQVGFEDSGFSGTASMFYYVAPSAGSHSISISENSLETEYDSNFAMSVEGVGSSGVISSGNSYSGNCGTPSGTLSLGTGSYFVASTADFNTGSSSSGAFSWSGSPYTLSTVSTLHQGDGLDTGTANSIFTEASPATYTYSVSNNQGGSYCNIIGAAFQPTALSVSSNSIGADAGSPVTITANVIDSASPYTYNFMIYSKYGLVANALYSSVSSTSNSFTFLQNSFWGTGTFTANVVVTDSGTNSGSVSQSYTVANGVTSYLPSTLPINVISYIPMTLSNSQPSPEPSNTNLMIPFNALKYEAYEGSGLQNLEFFYSNGTIIPSWLEGNILNGQQYTSLYTVSNVTYWIRIASNTFLPANSTNTIYLGFGVNSTNFFDGITVGEAPELSQNYGQYDNGANVFALYFNGDTALSTFNSATGVSITQATGVSYGSETINAINVQGKYNCGCHYYYGFSLSQAFANTGIIVESNFKNLNTGADQGVASIVDSPTALSVQNGVSVDQGYGSTYFSQTYVQSGSVHPDQNGQGSVGGSWLYGTLNYPGSSGTSWSGFVAPQLYSSSSGYSGTLNNNPLSSASQVYIGLVGYLNSANSNNWNEDLNWMRARVNPVNGAQPQANTQQLAISPSNSLLDYGQYLTFSFVMKGGTGPFTVQLTASNGTVIQSLTGQSDGTISFNSIIPPIGSDSYNAVIIDTATTPQAYFSTNSNTVTVKTAPTILPSLNSTDITIGQSILYTASIPSLEGVGPFTVNILAGGVVLSTNTLAAGSTNTLIYSPGATGSISFNTIAVDSHTSTPYVFSSVSNSLTVNPISTTTTISPTTVPCTGSCVHGSGGTGASGTVPTTQSTASSTSTLATTILTTTSTVQTTIPAVTTTPPPPIEVTVKQQGETTPPLCNGIATGYNVTYSQLSTTFQVGPGISGCFNMTAVNVTAIHVNSTANNTKKLITAVNFTVSNMNVSVNATMSYPCSIPSANIAPFILINGTWKAIEPFTVNAAQCTITFSVPADPVIAIFQTSYINSQTTTVASAPVTPQSKQNQNYIILAFVLVVVAVLVIFVTRSRRRSNRIIR